MVRLHRELHLTFRILQVSNDRCFQKQPRRRGDSLRGSVSCFLKSHWKSSSPFLGVAKPAAYASLVASRAARVPRVHLDEVEEAHAADRRVASRSAIGFINGVTQKQMTTFMTTLGCFPGRWVSLLARSDTNETHGTGYGSRQRKASFNRGFAWFRC